MLLRSCCEALGDIGSTAFFRAPVAAERKLEAELALSWLAVVAVTAVAAEPRREDEAVKSGIEEDASPADFCLGWGEVAWRTPDGGRDVTAPGFGCFESFESSVALLASVLSLTFNSCSLPISRFF